MLYELVWSPFSLGRHETKLILCNKIIHGLAEVTFEGILIKVYMGIITKQKKTLRQIGHSTSSMIHQSFSDKNISARNGLTFAEAPALAEFKYKRSQCHFDLMTGMPYRHTPITIQLEDFHFLTATIE